MLDRVILSSSAHESLLFHSLTSESEEIMGLLIGEAVEDGESNVVTFFAVEPLARIDKRPDRVEISPEDMVKSRNAAEEMSLVETGTRDRLRVLGWYHSHPHLTVHPSNVDLRTQCGMQMLDKNFVGIIMAAFNKRRDEAKILVMPLPCVT
jgi:BRCA1/BRCA2-containing complex subunit 3